MMVDHSQVTEGTMYDTGRTKGRRTTITKPVIPIHISVIKILKAYVYKKTDHIKIKKTQRVARNHPTTAL